MRRFTIPVVIGIAAMIAACNQEQASTSKSETTAQDVIKETKDAGQSAQNFAAQQKEEFIKQAQQQLESLKSEVKVLEAKAEQASEDARAGMKEKLDTLKEKQQAAEEKLSELKMSSEEAWEELRKGFTLALDDLQDSTKQALSEYE